MEGRDLNVDGKWGNWVQGIKKQKFEPTGERRKGSRKMGCGGKEGNRERNAGEQNKWHICTEMRCETHYFLCQQKISNMNKTEKNYRELSSTFCFQTRDLHFHKIPRELICLLGLASAPAASLSARLCKTSSLVLLFLNVSSPEETWRGPCFFQPEKPYSFFLEGRNNFCLRALRSCRALENEFRYCRLLEATGAIHYASMLQQQRVLQKQDFENLSSSVIVREVCTLILLYLFTMPETQNQSACPPMNER